MWAQGKRMVSLVVVLLIAGLLNGYAGGHQLAQAAERHRQIRQHNQILWGMLEPERGPDDGEVAELRRQAWEKIRQTRALFLATQAEGQAELRRHSQRVRNEQVRRDMEGAAATSADILNIARQMGVAGLSSPELQRLGRVLRFKVDHLDRLLPDDVGLSRLGRDVWSRHQHVLQLVSSLGTPANEATDLQLKEVASNLTALATRWQADERQRQVRHHFGQQPHPAFQGNDPITGRPLPARQGPRARSPRELANLPTSQQLLMKWSDEATSRIVPTSGQRAAPNSADLAATPEVQLTPEIIALANSLGNDPLRIYNWVTQNIRYRVYAGAVYGSQGTWEGRLGNDVDQASLLIALYRAAGIPARYESGTVNIPAAQVPGLTGISDVSTSASALWTIGIPTVVVYGGSGPVSMKMLRTWVVANVPYTNYRGMAGSGGGDSLWVRLDPAARQHEVVQRFNFSDDVSFDVNGFLSASQDQSVLAYYQEKVRDQIAASGSRCETVDDTQAQVIDTTPEVPILPNQLPWPLANSPVEAASLSTSQRYSMTVSVLDSYGFPLISITRGLPDLYGHRVALSFPSGGGVLSDTSGYVKPTLTIDGQIVAQGAAVQSGSDVPVYVEFHGPELSTFTRSHPAIAGGTYVLGAAIGPVPQVWRDRVDIEWRNLQNANAPQGQIDMALSQAALLTYHQHLVEEDDEIYAHHGWLIFGEYEAMVGTDTVPTYYWGIPRGARNDGYGIDAENGFFAAPLKGAYSSSQMARIAEISGYNGSFHEHKLWEEVLRLGAFSSTNVLQEARRQGQTIHFLTTSDDYLAVASRLQHDVEVENDVQEALANGEEVVISDRPVTRSGKTVSGYVLYDPDTGSAKYLIGTTNDGGVTLDDLSLVSLAASLFSAPIESEVEMPTAVLRSEVELLTFFAAGRTVSTAVHYSGQLDLVGDLGAGWTWTWGDRLFEDQVTHQVRYLDRFGRLTVFEAAPSGWSSPRGVPLLLTRTSSGYSLKAEAYELSFDTAGRLLRESDNYGNAISLVRNNSGQLTHIVDPAGNLLLTASLTADGKLSSLTDPMGHKASFTWSGSYLMSVNAPGNGLTSLTQDNTGRLVGKVRPDGVAITYGYDGESRLSLYSNDQGQTGNFAWDVATPAVVWTRPAGGEHYLAFNDDANVTDYIDPVGNKRHFEYDANGRLIAATDPRGGRTTLQRDSEGHVISVLRPDGQTLARTFNAEGKLLSETSAEGTRTWTYNDSTGETVVTGVSGENETFVRNSRGQLVSREVEGEKLSYTYDGRGNVVGIANQDGPQLNFERDKNGNMLSQSRSDGATTEFEWDAQGRPTSMQTPDGATFVMTYNGVGNLSLVTDPHQQVWKLGWKGDEVTSLEDPEGRRVTFELDAEGRVISTIGRLGRRSSQVLDPLGRVISSTDERGNLTEHFWCADISNEPCDIVDSRANLIQRTFDISGNLIEETSTLGTREWVWESCLLCEDPYVLTQEVDVLGYRTEYQRDSRGNLSQVKDALGHITRYEYDGSSRLIAMEDASGAYTQWIRNGSGKVTQVIDALNRVTSYDWDNSGQLIGKIDAAGLETTYEFDEMGRIVGQTSEDGSSRNFVWDHFGNLLRAANGEADIEYIYGGPGGRLSTVVQHSIDTQLDYAWDARTGQVASVNRPDGIQSYVWGSFGELLSTTLPTGQKVGFTYDRYGRLIQKTLPNGHVEYNTWDSWDRLTSRTSWDLSGVLVVGVSYTYDAMGRRISQALSNGTRTDYKYDGLSRLIEEKQGGSVRTYVYDEVGNRLSVSLDGVVQTSYVYDAGHQLQNMSESGVQSTYTWSDRGELLTRTKNNITTHYSYDAAGQLAGVSQGNTQLSTFTYDALGRLATRLEGGQHLSLLYDRDHEIAELGEDHNLVRSHTYGGGLDDIVSMTDWESGGESYFYHTDGLGSVLALSNENGSMVNTYRYNSFGALEVEQSGVEDVLSLAGRPFDQSSGTYDMRARRYDPGLGRFLTADPRTPESFEQPHVESAWKIADMTGLDLAGLMKTPQQLNPYSYVANDPLNHTDPSGMSSNSAFEMYVKWISNFTNFLRAFALLFLFLGAGSGGLPILSLGMFLAGIYMVHAMLLLMLDLMLYFTSGAADSLSWKEVSKLKAKLALLLFAFRGMYLILLGVSKVNPWLLILAFVMAAFGESLQKMALSWGLPWLKDMISF